MWAVHRKLSFSQVTSFKSNGPQNEPQMNHSEAGSEASLLAFSRNLEFIWCVQVIDLRLLGMLKVFFFFFL